MRIIHEGRCVLGGAGLQPCVYAAVQHAALASEVDSVLQETIRAFVNGTLRTVVGTAPVLVGVKVTLKAQDAMLATALLHVPALTAQRPGRRWKLG